MNVAKTLQLYELIPICLLAVPDRGLTVSELKKSLNPLFARSLTSEQWSHELAHLENQSMLQATGRTRYRITAAGKAMALQMLGIASLPVTISWQTIKKCYLIPYILGLTAPINHQDRQRITRVDGLRAMILVHIYQLPINPYPTLTEARDCLLWQQLTHPQTMTNLRTRLSASSHKPFTQNTLMTLLLNDLLGATRDLPWESALKQLIAKITHAQRTDAEALRLAIFRTATSEQPITPRSASDSATEFDLEIFAKQVLQSAHRCQTGRWGESKLFISHVWKQMGTDGQQFGLDFDQFKYYLALANNKGLVRLTHADLVQLMDPEDVRLSAISYGKTVFHFIHLEPSND